MSEKGKEVQTEKISQEEQNNSMMSSADLQEYIQNEISKAKEEIVNHYKPQLEGLTKKNSELIKQIESANGEKLTVEEQVQQVKEELAKEKEDKRWITAFNGIEENVVNIFRSGNPEEIAKHYREMQNEIKKKAVEEAGDDLAKKFGRSPTSGGDINVDEIDKERFKTDMTYAIEIKKKSPETYQKYKSLIGRK